MRKREGRRVVGGGKTPHLSHGAAAPPVEDKIKDIISSYLKFHHYETTLKSFHNEFTMKYMREREEEGNTGIMDIAAIKVKHRNVLNLAHI
jgi:hypothetical protein